MKKVKAIEVCFCEEDVKSMDNIWGKVSEIFETLGYMANLDKRDNLCDSINKNHHFYHIDKEIGIEDCADIVKAFEKYFEVNGLDFETQHDIWDPEIYPAAFVALFLEKKEN